MIDKKGRLPLDMTGLIILLIIAFVILVIVAGIFYEEIIAAFESALEKITWRGG